MSHAGDRVGRLHQLCGLKYAGGKGIYAIHKSSRGTGEVTVSSMCWIRVCGLTFWCRGEAGGACCGTAGATFLCCSYKFRTNGSAVWGHSLATCSYSRATRRKICALFLLASIIVCCFFSTCQTFQNIPTTGQLQRAASALRRPRGRFAYVVFRETLSHSW